MASTPARPKGKLFFSQLGGEQPIPPKFLAAMERWEEREPVKNDVKPEPLSDEIVESSTTTDRLNERIRRTIKKKPGPIKLRDIRTNDAGQPIQVELTLFWTKSKFKPEVPTLTRMVAIEDLGNGFSIQEVLIEGRYDEAGTFIEEPFQNIELMTERSEWVPDKFAVAAEREQRQTIEAGTVLQPTLAPEDLRISEKQLSLYKKLVTRLTRDGVEFPVVLISKRTNQQKQIVTVTETLRLVGTAPVPSATQDSVTQALGNGYEVVITEVVPSVFPDSTFTKQVDDAVPQEFRVALPISDTSSVSAGSAIMPPLGAGDLLATQKQITAFTKLVRLVTRSGLSLPISLVGKDTNDRGQIVTITRTYRVAGTDPVPTATMEVAVQALGDGNVIETTREIETVFGNETYVLERPDPLPPEFRAALTQEETQVDSEGTASAPSALTTGELAKTETQLTAFVKRARSIFRATTDTTLADGELEGVRDGRGAIFDGLVGIQRFLTSSLQTLDEGFQVISSRLRQLGNGQWLKETGTIESYPTLVNETVEQDTGIREVETKTLVSSTAGPPTHPGGNVDQLALSKHRTLRISRSANTDSYDSYQRVFPGNTNVDFPSELVSLTGYEEFGFEAGTYGPLDAQYSLSSQGSGSISLRANVQGSAHTMLELGFDIRQLWGVGVPCTHVLFLLPVSGSGVVTRAAVLAKLSVILTPATVNDWPVFQPEAVSFVCKGQKVSATKQLDAHASDHVRQDYLGAVKWSSLIRTTHVGDSIDLAGSVKVIRLPPTIHPLRNVGGGVNSNTRSTTATGLISTGVNDTGIVGVGVNAFSSILPTSAPATSGTNTITSALGIRLYRLTTELYKNGYLKFHAEVINFADFT